MPILSRPLKDIELSADLDLLPCAVLVTDEQGHVIATNAELREQFGEPARDGAQRHLEDWLPPASRIFVQTHVWPLLLRKGRVDEIHLRLLAHHGEQWPVLLNARRQPGDAPPATTRIHWAFFKAVERQRFEGELLKTRQRLQNLLLSSNAGTWEWHVPSGALKVNERWAAIVGWTVQDTQALDLESHSAQIHPEEREPLMRQLAALLQGGRQEYFSEHRMQHRQGHWIWVQERGRIVSRLPDGRPEWVFGSLVDSSHAVAQREALRRSEALLSRTNDLAGVGGWEWDLRNQQLFWSAQTCRIHGVAENYEPQLAEALDFYPGDARAQIEAAVAQGLREGHSWDLQLPFVRRDGTSLMVRTMGAVDREDGRPVRLIGAFQDVTEQHRLMQTLREAKLAAEAASEAKSMFLANMSHEIRTPMNAIIGIGHLLADTPLNEDQQQLLRKLQSAGRSLLSLIDDVLDLAKIEAGEMGMERAAYRPHELLQELDAMFAPQAERKKLGWWVNVPPDLPLFLMGDVTRMRQVLSNLLSNALKFTQDGGVSLHVVVMEGLMRISVRDTGIGIAPEAQGKLFQPFAQADATTTRRFGGTGLGLFIARRLVELMGGRMSLRSALGEGAEFSIELPLEPRESLGSDVAMPHGLVAPPAPRGARLAGVRLLVVDDSEINLEVLRRMLEREGACVVCENRAVSALALLQQEECFAAVLMDIQMPEMDGLEATRRIRQMPGLARLPVLALTAGALAEERRRALDVGMDAFLTKPLEPAKLLEALADQGIGGPPRPATTETAPQRRESTPATSTAIEGLNADEALARLGGDLALFYRLIARLLSSFDASWLQSLSACNHAELTSELHKLRGSAATLGAGRIETLAAQAEEGLRQGSPEAEVRSLLDALTLALGDLRRSAEPVLAQRASSVEPPESTLGLSDAEAVQQFEELLTLLRQQDLGAADALAALMPWLRSLGVPDVELRRISHELAELDFEPARRFFAAWRDTGAAFHRA